MAKGLTSGGPAVNPCGGGEGMATTGTAAVRMFGRLHTLRRQAGLADAAEISLPPEGRTAAELARELGLPAGEIEAVFCNHKTYGLDHVVRPGDEVAFVPRGIPGPHRFTLGIYAAGRGERR